MATAPRTADPGAAADPAGVNELAARREARDVLRIAEGLCGYAGQRLDHGASPAAAAWTIAQAAAELARVSVVLRRLSRIGRIPAGELVVMLAAEGVARRDIASALGLPSRVVAGYLNQAGQPVSPAGR